LRPSGANPIMISLADHDRSRSVAVASACDRTGEVSYNEEHDAVGQIAELVEAGAEGIASDSTERVAFLNTAVLNGLPTRLTMKTFVTSLTLLALALAGQTAFSQTSEKGMNHDSFLHAQGGSIVNGTGETVFLRGVNLGGWLLMEGWQTPMDSSGLKDDWSVRETLAKRFGPRVSEDLIATYEDNWINESDLDNIANLGMNVVRLPFWYRNVESEEGVWRDDAFKRMDWLVSNAAKRGIYTIIDLHGAPGGQSGGDSTGRARKIGAPGANEDFWNEQANIKRTDEIWRRVAAHFRGNPGVAAYDVLNEPTGAPTRQALWDAYDHYYQIIRAADPEHIITVEGAWGGKTDGKYTGWGWEQLPPPSKYHWTNMLYQQHVYEYSGWNSYPKQKKATDNAVAGWLARQSWNVPFLVGEFNCMGQAWDYSIKKYSQNNISWIMWTYKAIHGSGNDSWGVYNPRQPWPEKPNIAQDSAADIKAKWAAWTTHAAFELNPLHKQNLTMAMPVDDSYSTRVSTTLRVKKPGILENDKHVNVANEKLEARVLTNPKNGSLQLQSDGSFTFTPAPGFIGRDSFRYRVFDGRLESARVGTVDIMVGNPKTAAVSQAQ
jgi:endoglucanase